MPLLDHFHAPLHPKRRWESFHTLWAGSIYSALNAAMPEGFFAEAQVHARADIEIDVAGFQDRDAAPGGGTAVATRAVPALAAPHLIIPITFPPTFEVRVFEMSGGYRLIAVVELVSPGNKDRPETRRAFTAKCLSYVTEGLGLVVVDVVTDRRSRPFEELIAELHPGGTPPEAGPLTAASYRPVRTESADHVEVRVEALEVGRALPELPLALGGFGYVMIDLEATYEEARSKSRLP